ncbi:MAG TPA: hypothetical protein ENI95_07060 [Chloroflexi bacterium]|nr:hypothetical protein [Chloroflexota bacterium]
MDTLELFLFLSLFSLVGGGIAGAAVNSLAVEPRSAGNIINGLYRLLFGLAFGAFPLFASISEGNRLLTAGQIGVLVTAFIAAALMGKQLRAIGSSSTLMSTILGGIFVVIGLGMLGFLFRGEGLISIVVPLVFAGLGGAFFVSGLLRIIRGDTEGEI